MRQPDLQVGGFVPFTTVDFPGRLAAVVFCQGCQWRCRYCHNPHLRHFGPGSTKWTEILDALQKRRGFLEAVVFSGGEPTAQPALPQAMREVKAMGFLTGLHTAGIHPRRLRKVLPLTDWIGLDAKAPLDERHDNIVGKIASFQAPAESLRLLLASGIPYELRTTVHPALLNNADLADLQSGLRKMGAAPSKIQPFRQSGCTDANLLASMPGTSFQPPG